MNAQLKTILLTVITLSLFTITLVELSGVSSTALFNKYHFGSGGSDKGVGLTNHEADQRHQQALAMPKTILAFTDTKFSFGKIKEGDVVKHAFHFKNAGNAPLLISRAEASCGCTVPSFPKEPVPPGGEGDVLVQFDSHNRKGHQQKNVLVWSNSQLEKMSIGFDAEVE
jgi:hypothetical protein